MTEDEDIAADVTGVLERYHMEVDIIADAQTKFLHMTCHAAPHGADNTIASVGVTVPLSPENETANAFQEEVASFLAIAMTRFLLMQEKHHLGNPFTAEGVAEA